MEKHEQQGSAYDAFTSLGATETKEDALFQALWNALVPSSGRAQSAQGEIIRIAGRIQHEFLDNGGVNWDDDFRAMLRTFPQYLRLGNPFSEEEIKSAEALTSLLLAAGDEGRIDYFLCSALCSCAVAWVQQNTNEFPPLEAEYSR